MGQALHREDGVVVLQEFGENLHDEGVPVRIDKVHRHEAGVEEDAFFAKALDEVEVGGGRAVTSEANVTDEAFLTSFEELVNDAVLPALIDVVGADDGMDLPKIETVGLEVAQGAF